MKQERQEGTKVAAATPVAGVLAAPAPRLQRIADTFTEVRGGHDESG